MKNDGLDPRLKTAFDDLRAVPPRDPQAARRGRLNFMRLAASLRQSPGRTVRTRPGAGAGPLQGRPRLSALRASALVLLALVVLFGGTVATAYAAQDSLPGAPFYPLKTWSEDALLSLAGSPPERLEYVLQFSERRVEEMAGLLAAGEPIPAGVVTRLQEELDLALELAAGLDDSQMAAQLEFVRQRAVAQALSAAQLAAAAPEADQPILAAVQARLEEQARLAASGQTDPAGFRRQVRQRGGDQGDSGEATSPGGGGSQVTGQTPVPTGTCDDAGGYGTGGTLGPSGQGSRTPDRTPQPGGGSGHGP